MKIVWTIVKVIVVGAVVAFGIAAKLQETGMVDIPMLQEISKR